MGRYVFGPSIYDAIEHISPHARGEIQLTDAIAYLVEKGERVLAYDVDGKLFDIGQAHGWFAANMYLGLKLAVEDKHMRKIIKDLL